MSDETNMKRIEGRCHCGNIRFSFELPHSGSKISVRACSCTFCRKHGGVYTSHPKGRLSVEIADPTRATRYRFGTETADFHVCRQCGAVPVVTSEISGRLHAVVNVNCFENMKSDDFAQAVADFEGESTELRLARRQRNWIAQVEIAAQKRSARTSP